jgi:hypothetical protein
MAGFKINKKSHSDLRRQERIRSMTSSPNENEAKVAKSKLRPSASVDLPNIKKENKEIKLVDIILGEEKCGKGMYWCNTDKKCKKIPSGFKIHGQIGMNPEEVGIDKPTENGESQVSEKVTLEDAFGNTFCEFIDLIKPEDILSVKEAKKSEDDPCWKGYTQVGMKNKNGKEVPNCVPSKGVPKAKGYKDKVEEAKKEPDHEQSMIRSELETIRKAVDRLKSKMKGEGNVEAWVQSKITKAADYIDSAADYIDSGEHNVHNSMDEEKKKDDPCWKGYRQVGMKKKNGKEVPNCVPVDESVRLPSEFGHLVSVVVMWRTKTYGIRMFFPQAKMPNKREVQAEIEKVYPGGRVIQFMMSDLPSNYIPSNSPLFRVNKEEFEIEESKVDKDKMKCNKPKADPVGDSKTGKSHVVKACEGGKEKIIRFGQRGVEGSPARKGESEASKNRRGAFKDRHAKNIAKGKMSAAYWANKVKW